ncbi:MAG: glycosyltransferase family 39 protein, partial [Bacteroidetes bacterium]|nr:glycosyltransferase family 39 protein [Bacteroidota bacterium]
MADSAEYLKQAENIKSSLSFYCGDLTKNIDNDLYTRRPPVYGILITVLELFTVSDFAVILFQSALSILTMTGLFVILRDEGYEKISYAAIPLFLLLFPPQEITANFIMAEILLQSLIFWAFLCFYRYGKTKEVKYMLFYNLLLAAGVLTKPVLLYFWIPNLLFSFYLYYKNRKFAVVAASLIMPSVILAVCLMNLGKTGYFHYSSLKDNNLLYYNGYFILVNTKNLETANREIEETQKYLFGIQDYRKMSEERARLGTELVMNNMTTYAKLHLKGVFNYFFDPGRFDFLNFTGQLNEKNNEGMMFIFAKEGYAGVIKQLLKQNPALLAYLFVVFFMNVILFAGFLIFLIKKNVETEIKILAALMVFFMGFMSGPLGTLRYKIHIVPLMLFGCIIAVSGLLNRKK